MDFIGNEYTDTSQTLHIIDEAIHIHIHIHAGINTQIQSIDKNQRCICKYDTDTNPHACINTQT